jgi:hypothetical protein
MDNRFNMLRAYAIFVKLMSLLAFVLGLVFEGLLFYGWGRLTATYDMIRTTWQTIVDSYNSFNLYSTTGISLPALAPLPIWPLIVTVLVVFLFTIVIALTLWAIGQLIDTRIILAKEERESRAMLAKAMGLLTRDLNSVANYFSSLPRSKA